jgi:hypothetical protein
MRLTAQLQPLVGKFARDAMLKQEMADFLFHNLPDISSDYLSTRK